MSLALIALFGLLIGSFLSVCIYRIPLGRSSGSEESDSAQDQSLRPSEVESDKEKISFFYPSRSICLSCRKQLRWWHNIPLFSWLALGGRCAYCKERISFRYPLIELMTSGAALASFSTFGMTISAFIIFAFVCSLIVISFIDYDFYIIPNVISIPGTFLGILLGITSEFLPIFSEPLTQGIKDSLLGVLVGAGFLLLVSEVYLRLRKKDGLGMGDVKLLAMTGAFFGFQGALYTIFVGSLFGSLLGILFILFSKRSISYQLPFGPYLAAATVLYIFTEDRLVLMILDLMSST